MNGASRIVVLIIVARSAASTWADPVRETDTFLLDHGTDPSTGRTVSGWEAPFGGLTVFQPFTVEDPAWQIDTIGLDGGWHGDSDATGFIATLLPDSGGEPDESSPLAAATFELDEIVAPGSMWKYEVFDVMLTEGSYWLRAAAYTPHLQAGIFVGLSGEDSISRRGDGGADIHASPIAMRISGVVVPESSTLIVLLAGALALVRRARSMIARD